MARVKFTRSLNRFFPDLCEADIDGSTVAEIVAGLDERWAGLADYIVDEQGRLRPHVNIFIGDELIYDKQTLSDPVDDTTRVYIFQALSGG
jgi:molybdopterin synthase sulfur carrier subunit